MPSVATPGADVPQGQLDQYAQGGHAQQPAGHEQGLVQPLRDQLGGVSHVKAAKADGADQVYAAGHTALPGAGLADQLLAVHQ